MDIIFQKLHTIKSVSTFVVLVKINK